MRINYKQAHKTRGVWGDAPPGDFLEIRCSEIASGAIFAEPIFDCPTCICSADFKFPREKV